MYLAERAGRDTGGLVPDPRLYMVVPVPADARRDRAE